MVFNYFGSSLDLAPVIEQHGVIFCDEEADRLPLHTLLIQMQGQLLLPVVFKKISATLDCKRNVGKLSQSGCAGVPSPAHFSPPPGEPAPKAIPPCRDRWPPHTY